MKNKTFDFLKSRLSLIVTITVIIGVLFRLDGRWAKATDVKQLEQYTQQHIQKVEKRLDLKILQDQLADVRRRTWSLEDRYDNDINKMPETVKEEYRNLKEEKEELQKKIDSIIEKIEKEN